MTEDIGPKRSKGGRMNAPWSSKGWYGAQQRAARNPELERLIAAEGRGRINPKGYEQDRPIFAISPAMHNPYLNVVFGAVMAWVGWFLFEQMMPELVPALALGGLFWFAAAFITVFSLVRAPSWHRARRVAKRYLCDHPGELPPELRWHN